MEEEKQIHPAAFSARATVWKNIILVIDLLLLWEGCARIVNPYSERHGKRTCYTEPLNVHG